MSTKYDLQQIQIIQRYSRSCQLRDAIMAFELRKAIDFYLEPEVDDRFVATIGEWQNYLVKIRQLLYVDALILAPMAIPEHVDYSWHYPKGAAPVIAALVWDPQSQGEPSGFKQRLGDRIRRPGERSVHEPDQLQLP